MSKLTLLSCISKKNKTKQTKKPQNNKKAFCISFYSTPAASDHMFFHTQLSGIRMLELAILMESNKTDPSNCDLEAYKMHPYFLFQKYPIGQVRNTKRILEFFLAVGMNCSYFAQF